MHPDCGVKLGEDIYACFICSPKDAPISIDIEECAQRVTDMHGSKYCNDFYCIGFDDDVSMATCAQCKHALHTWCSAQGSEKGFTEGYSCRHHTSAGPEGSVPDTCPWCTIKFSALDLTHPPDMAEHVHGCRQTQYLEQLPSHAFSSDDDDDDDNHSMGGDDDIIMGDADNHSMGDAGGRGEEVQFVQQVGVDGASAVTGGGSSQPPTDFSPGFT